MNNTVDRVIACLVFGIAAILAASVFEGAVFLFLKNWSWLIFWVFAFVVFVILMVLDARSTMKDQDDYYASIEHR